MREAKALAEATAAEREAGRFDASSLGRQRAPGARRVGPVVYFYCAAGVLWLLGVLWLALYAAAPGMLELALTQLPVAGAIIAAQLYKQKKP